MNNIKFKAVVVLVVLLVPLPLTFCSDSEKKFLSEIGVCTSLTNSGIVSKYGYAYIEESVQSFLIPDKSEEEFNVLLAEAKESPLPIKACNLFLPGRLKSVGEEAVHDKILDYAETAFRRAQIVGVKTLIHSYLLLLKH